MGKKRKFKLKFKTVMIFVFIVLIIGLGLCIKDIIGVLKSSSASEVEVLSEIKDYGYTLNENDSEYFKEKFMLLKTELEKEEIDEEKYASLISELFVIDFYSLNSALNKNDVGGAQFVYTDYKEDFVKFAKEGIYKYVENNIYGDRKQDLPIVTETEIKSIEQDKAIFDNDVEDTKAYIVEVLVTYKEDLEYPTEVKLIAIHKDNKLEIAKLD